MKSIDSRFRFRASKRLYSVVRFNRGIVFRLKSDPQQLAVRRIVINDEDAHQMFSFLVEWINQAQAKVLRRGCAVPHPYADKSLF
jgi:hypothetical protein